MDNEKDMSYIKEDTNKFGMFKKRILCSLFLTLLCSVFIVTSANAATPKSTKIAMSKKNVSLYKGQKYKLSIKKANSKVKHKSVKWTTSNKKIVIVNKNGNIKGIKKGTAYVYCKVKWKNNKTSTVKCKVKVYNPVKLKSYKLSKTSVKLKVGDKTTVKKIINPTNATIVKTAIATSNKKVAIINSKGVITAKGVGVAKICIAIKTYNNKVYKKYCTVTVVKRPTVKPTAIPTPKPTVAPTIKPTVKPTSTPTVEPTAPPVIKGSVTINYVDIDENKIITTDIYDNLDIKEYTYKAKDIDGYVLNDDAVKVVNLTEVKNKQTIEFRYNKIRVYTIDLDYYDISNNNTNAYKTTVGINMALEYAKNSGYNKVILPKGHYAIDTSVKNPIKLTDGESSWTHNRQGIAMQSGIELVMTGAVLEMVPVEDPYYSIFTISNCENATITGGTILGDKDKHDYGMRINEDGKSFISGDIDTTTGEYKEDETRVVTKDFIEYYEDWFTKEKESLPRKFFVIPLWNTSMNTVDGGCAYVHCYDSDGNYLGMTTGGGGYVSEKNLPEGTTKIKISLRGEKRLDPVIAITKRTVYSTYEFGACITVADSNNITIQDVVAKNSIGDCMLTFAPPLKVTVDDLNVLNCIFENSRRQGISFVATGEDYLVKDCNIGNIAGTDPQCGIDFEHYDYVKNVVIDGTSFYNNKKWDIINYNGTNIEVKNGIFTGAIATTYGHSMNIHNNVFEYADTPNKDKVYKNCLLSIGTDNNKVYKNVFKGGNVSNSGTNSVMYDNSYYDGEITITSNGKNNYYNCDVGIKQSENFPVLADNYFEKSNVFCHGDRPSIQIKDSMFNDSSFNGRGPCLITNCTFELKEKFLISGWKTEATDITFEKCNIVSQKNFMDGGNFKVTFKESSITTARESILEYGTTTFTDSKITFLQNGGEEDIIWNRSGYGYEKCPWYFTNCTFESQLPVTIAGGNVVNPQIIGNITIN